jgi:hypothetical protein
MWAPKRWESKPKVCGKGRSKIQGPVISIVYYTTEIGDWGSPVDCLPCKYKVDISESVENVGAKKVGVQTEGLRERSVRNPGPSNLNSVLHY